MRDDTPHPQFIPSFIFGDPNRCTYCGAPDPTDIDHVLPVSSYSEKTRKNDRHQGIRTYACRKCNGSLGPKVFPSFHDRLLHVQGCNLRRAADFRKDRSWDDEEISSLDHTLRTFVANRQLRMRESDNRISWQGSPGFHRAISNLRGVHCLDRSSHKYLDWAADYFTGYF